MTEMRSKELIEVVWTIMGRDGISRDAVLSRVKQWQKMGIPAGSNTGKGKHATYTREMVWEVMLVAELGNLGIPPQAAHGFIRDLVQQAMSSVATGQEFCFRPAPHSISFITLNIVRLHGIAFPKEPPGTLPGWVRQRARELQAAHWEGKI